MSIQISFLKTDPTEALKKHAQKRVEKFLKFVSYPIEINVLLSVDRKSEHIAEITIHAEHRELVAIATSKDLYESVDIAAHKIEAQLKKEREKRKGHAKAHTAARKAGLKAATDLEAELPHTEKRVVRNRASTLK